MLWMGLLPQPKEMQVQLMEDLRMDQRLCRLVLAISIALDAGMALRTKGRLENQQIYEHGEHFCKTGMFSWEA